MSRLLAVVRREYVERVRSKAFVIGTALGPLLLAALSLGPSLLMGRQHGQALRLAVVDDSGQVGAALAEALRARTDGGRARFDVRPTPAGGREERFAALKQQVLSGALDGYLYVPADGLARCAAEYRGSKLSNLTDLALLDDLAEGVLRRARLKAAGLDAALLDELTRERQFKRIQLSSSGEREDHGASFLLAFTLLMSLYTTLAMWGSALMNGVIEEKVNRVVEVVVSSIPTTTLFTGKLLGVGGAGLTQLSVWSLFAGVLGLLGSRAGVSLPELAPGLLLALLLFFLLGFFLYGGLYMAVGAAVNSQQEAQSLAFPVMSPLIVGVLFFPAVLNSPDSRLAVLLSLVPCWTPLLMFLRLSASSPPLWQVLLSVVFTLVAIALVTWGAARIYRVGILMYGKRPTLPELLRWAGHR